MSIKIKSTAMIVLMLVGLLSANQVVAQQDAEKDQDSAKLIGRWTVDLEATKNYLKEQDREDELDAGFEDIAETIVLEIMQDGKLTMHLVPAQQAEPLTLEQTYETKVNEDGTVRLIVTEQESGNTSEIAVEFVGDDRLRFTPADSFPVMLIKTKADADKDKGDDDGKEGMDKKPAETNVESSDLVGEWRVNMDKTLKHLKDKGMKQEELDEISTEMDNLQIAYAKDGSFKMEMGGREMSGTWEIKSFDKDSNTTSYVMNLSVGGGSSPRKFSARKLEDGSYLISPEGDPESIFERITVDDDNAKIDDD